MAAHVDMTKAHIKDLTSWVSALEDAWGRVEHLTKGVPTIGFMDDFVEFWLETVMARERDYRPILRRVVILVATVAPVVALRAVVGPGAPPEGETP